MVFSRYMPSSGIAGSFGSSVFSFSFIFKEPLYCSPRWLYQFALPPTVQEGSLFSTPSEAFIVCRLFDGGHSDQCELIHFCGFNLHFSPKQRHQTSFQVTIGHLFVFCGEVSVLIFCPVFDLVVCLFVLILSCMSCLYILEINPSEVASFAYIVSQSKSCIFVRFLVSFILQKGFKFNQVSFV